MQRDRTTRTKAGQHAKGGGTTKLGKSFGGKEAILFLSALRFPFLAKTGDGKRSEVQRNAKGVV